MAFSLSMNASDIDKTLVESRQLLDSDPATKQYVDEKATWEALPDKPTIFEGGDTLTWDGDTTGLVSVMDMFYKVSDAIPVLEDFASGATLNVHGNDSASAHWPAETFVEIFDGVIAGPDMRFLAVSPNAVGVDLDGIVFSETGTYFTLGDGMYLASLTIPGYTGFGKEVIDPDYLPESVKGGEVGEVYVTFAETDGTYTADMAFAEVETLVSAGKTVVAKLLMEGMTVYERLSVFAPGSGAYFSVAYAGGAKQITVFTIKYLADGTIELYEPSVTTT